MKLSATMQLLADIFNNRRLNDPHPQSQHLGPPPLVLIAIMLGAAQIDGVDAAIDSPTTRIGRLPRDLRSMIRERLWVNKEYCGVRHRDGYRYGVRHTGSSPWIRRQPGWNRVSALYVDMGLLHRDDGPAYLECDDYQHPLLIRDHNKVVFYQHGHIHRTRGPAIMYDYKIIHHIRHERFACNYPSLFIHDDHVAITTYGKPYTYSMSIYHNRIVIYFTIPGAVMTTRLEIQPDGIMIGNVLIRHGIIAELYKYLQSTVSAMNPTAIVERECMVFAPVLDDLRYNRLH